MYKLHKFINYDEFKIIFNQQFEGKPAESSFLKLKFDISSNFGPIDREKNTCPQYLTKMCQNGFFRPPLTCLKKQKGGQKTIGTSLGNIK